MRPMPARLERKRSSRRLRSPKGQAAERLPSPFPRYAIGIRVKVGKSEPVLFVIDTPKPNIGKRPGRGTDAFRCHAHQVELVGETNVGEDRSGILPEPIFACRQNPRIRVSCKVSRRLSRSSLKVRRVDNRTAKHAHIHEETTVGTRYLYRMLHPEGSRERTVSKLRGSDGSILRSRPSSSHSSRLPLDCGRSWPQDLRLKRIIVERGNMPQRSRLLRLRAS